MAVKYFMKIPKPVEETDKKLDKSESKVILDN
jgi:hypothetical protein